MSDARPGEASSLLRRVVDLLRRVVDVHAGEMPSLLLAWAYFFALLTSYYILRPLREQQGLVGDQVSLLVNFLGTLGGMAIANPLYAWIVTRWPRRKFIPFVYRFFLLNLLLFFAVTKFAPASWERPVAWAFFVWVSVYNLFVVAVFWSLMADLFTLEQGKRLFGFISVGGSLGAITGSTITGWLVTHLAPVYLLLVSAALLEATVQVMRGLVRARGLHQESVPAQAQSLPVAARPEETEYGSVFTGIGLVFRSSYLAWICLYMLLASISGTILYFAQADIVSAASADRGERTAIFARIDLCASSLTLLIQLFLTGRIVKRFGLGPTLAFQCVCFALALSILGLSPTLGALVVLMVLFRAGHYATSRPAREVLFTVVGREVKYKSKGFIDTFVYRGGDVLGAALKVGLSSFGGLGLRGIAFCSLPIAIAWGATALIIGRKHSELIRAQGRPSPLPRAEAVR